MIFINAIIALIFFSLYQDLDSNSIYIEEISRKQIRGFFIIVEIVYYVAIVIYYVYRWVRDRRGNKRLELIKKERKVRKHYTRIRREKI